MGWMRLCDWLLLATPRLEVLLNGMPRHRKFTGFDLIHSSWVCLPAFFHSHCTPCCRICHFAAYSSVGNLVILFDLWLPPPPVRSVCVCVCESASRKKQQRTSLLRMAENMIVNSLHFVYKDGLQFGGRSKQKIACARCRDPIAILHATIKIDLQTFHVQFVVVQYIVPVRISNDC